MNTMAGETNHTRRLSPQAIAAIEEILSKHGRRAEVKLTKGGGVQVTELTHKTAYKTSETA